MTNQQIGPDDNFEKLTEPINLKPFPKGFFPREGSWGALAPLTAQAGLSVA